uniref:Uncharacterized protein n=1 Tax=Chromera velia CCMP2878 TaxID=1169474 RepID=A0A0G4GQB0_9ALVE|eukprot:Cvel_22901.t1-p1 / transcript=Cvel_22901.t1 / gene=Cvel_22901 / organism=Chromera_velia_CCMP2878 / gene_product=hypothetical protein / transcript_product=hypothetical protein / location=Cvel_scaffold2301:7347-7949(-) / protein_length=90 / sequence_SO=supercontig / SO=protein_coding / is_pseudo=false
MEEVPLKQDEEEFILLKAIEAGHRPKHADCFPAEDGTNFAALLGDFFPSTCEANDSSENTNSNIDAQQQAPGKGKRTPARREGEKKIHRA